MSMHKELKKEILEINAELLRVLPRAADLAGREDSAFAAWEKICRTVREQVEREILRVAVIGSIKSGKSTFVNALLGGDYLKRGAGVVTSIVTKVRKGKRLRATLFLKSWDEVNAEIRQALVLFPGYRHDIEIEDFDIRRRKDRERIAAALAEMSADLFIENGGLNANTVLLSCYVSGFDRISDRISTENRTLLYEEEAFGEHAAFVADDTLAVYLQDIRLEVDSEGIGDNLEIADCQGSDSPNPLHLAMIQDYLLLAHLIVYVVSSRTGIRQADIKFLSMIRRMGILDNILFVVNTDFSEHESAEGLGGLVERVKADLSLVRPDPDVFAFSALYNLFRSLSERLPPRDRQRLSQWRSEAAFIDVSDRESRRFLEALEGMLTRDRAYLLFDNHLERMAVVGDGVEHWIDLHRDILSGDVQGASETMEKIAAQRDRIGQVAAVITSALKGAALEIKEELRADVDRFFSVRSGEAVGDTLRFVKNYDVVYEEYGESLQTSGFSSTLYLLFQGFRQALDRFLAESVNPVFIRFVRQEELKILQRLAASVEPYHDMVRDGLAGYEGLAEEGRDLSARPPAAEARGVSGAPDLDTVKELLNLSLPPLTSSMRFSARIKTDAVLHLGFFTVVGFARKIFKKTRRDQQADKIRALREGVKRIKQETEKALVFHFKNFRENLKFQYFFVLIDAAARMVGEKLTSRFGVYDTDLTHLTGLLDRRESEKEAALEGLEDLRRIVGNLGECITLNRQSIQEQRRGEHHG